MKYWFLIFLFAALPARADWTYKAEGGAAITSGNTSTQSYNLKSASRYTWSRNLLGLDGTYLFAKQSGVVSAKSWTLGLRYERELSERLSALLAQSAEEDKFAGISRRYNSDAGGKFYFVKKEKEFLLLSEAGYRYTRERDTNQLWKTFHKARVYAEAEKFFTESVSAKLWAEYIPNFSESKAWLLNGEVSLSSAMAKALALKSAYLVRYNNSPPAAAVKADRSLVASLVFSN